MYRRNNRRRVELTHYNCLRLGSPTPPPPSKIILFYYSFFSTTHFLKAIEFNDAIRSLLPPHTVCVLIIWWLNQKTQAERRWKITRTCVPCCVSVIIGAQDRSRPRPSWLFACSRSVVNRWQTLDLFFGFLFFCQIFFLLGCAVISICCCAINNQSCRGQQCGRTRFRQKCFENRSQWTPSSSLRPDPLVFVFCYLVALLLGTSFRMKFEFPFRTSRLVFVQR